MASSSSPMNPKNNYHARSISLPSRPHPFFLLIDEHLCRLKASQETSSSPSLTIIDNISCLLDLYDCVDEFLQLSSTQQALAGQESCSKWVNNMFDGSLKILDVCCVAKDVLLQFREHVQQLQSILRRRRGDEVELAKAASKYLIFKKKAKKVIQMSLKDFIKGKSCTFSSLEKDDQCSKEAVTSMLKEVERVTISVFESIVSFLSRTKATNGWSLISIFVQTIRTESEMSENEIVDVALYSFINHKTVRKGSNQALQIEKVQNQLGNLETSIQDLEEGLESLLRRLIKTRVSLLNILNH